MDKLRGWLRAAATIASLAGAAPAAAGVVKTSFGVGATVVATCRIEPGQESPCARQVRAPTINAERPVVTYSRDPKTGIVTETVEF